MRHGLMIAVLAFALRGSVAAAGTAEAAAREAERADEARAAAAAASAARVEQGVDQALAAARRALLLAAERSRPGAVVTPRAIYYVDGPIVPVENLELAGLAGVRPVQRPTTTDTLLRVRPGVTLSLGNVGGDVRVQVWDRNEVRVVAEHDRADRVVAELTGPQLRLGLRSRQGVPMAVEWSLSVPTWLPLELSNVEGDIRVQGLQAALQAQTVRGDINVEGCRGPLQANSIEGEVHLSDVNGNVSAGSVNNVIRLFRVKGPVEAQTVNGDIQMESVQSPNVDASTVNGRVFYASPYQPRGRYAFTSHNGRIYITVPPDEQNVNVTVQSFNGEVEAPEPLPAPRPSRRGRPVRFTWGEPLALPSPPTAPEAPAPPSPRAARGARGVAPPPPAPEIELESFGGQIRFVTETEMLRALDMQRMALDSLRQQLARERGLERKLVKLGRLQRRAQAEAERAPTPPDGQH